MGERIIIIYKRIKNEYKLAFVSTFIIALLTHFYKFTNTLPNHDSLFSYYSDQNILGSGRWALSAACGISSYYNLPWVIGIISCVCIALTTVVIVALFRMSNPVLIGLTGALLAASPAVTETFFFQYTADGYMISMFLAALSVYFIRIEERRVSRWILAGACLCVSCGIYQAYVSFALLLAVFYFVDGLLENRYTMQESFKWILRMGVFCALSLGAYYGIWQLCMYFSGIVANDYQGIDRVGKIPASLWGTLISYAWRRSVASVNNFFLQGNVLEYGFSLYSVLNLLFLVMMVVGIIIAVLRSGISKRLWATGIFLLCLFAIIPFSCLWYFVSSGVSYRAMMLQSLTLVYVIIAVLYEKWAKPFLKDAVCLLLLLIVFNNGLIANISYFYMDLSYEKTYADGLELYLDIHDMQDQYEFDKIAVVGTRNAEDIRFDMANNGEIRREKSFRIVSDMIHKTLIYDQKLTVQFLKTVFGLELTPLSGKECDAMQDVPEIQAMPGWPSKGSMKVIDDVLVIRFLDFN